MRNRGKPVEQLSLRDVMACPVWRFGASDDRGDVTVSPVATIPVKDPIGKLIGTKVSLANGQGVWALAGNVSSSNPALNEHFLTLSVDHDGTWLRLARYFDPDYSERGPDGLAQRLGLSTQDVFPIAYDFRPFVQGNPKALTGEILAEPRQRLTRAQLVALSVP